MKNSHLYTTLPKIILGVLMCCAWLLLILKINAEFHPQEANISQEPAKEAIAQLQKPHRKVNPEAIEKGVNFSSTLYESPAVSIFITDDVDAILSQD